MDARKLNEGCVKKRQHMPNREELLNQISAELSRNEHDSVWISVIHLDQACGQMKLTQETSKHCNFAVTGEIMNGYYRFLKNLPTPTYQLSSSVCFDSVTSTTRRFFQQRDGSALTCEAVLCESCIFLLLGFRIPRAILLVLLRFSAQAGTRRFFFERFWIYFCVSGGFSARSLCVGVLDTPSRVILDLTGRQFEIF